MRVISPADAHSDAQAHLNAEVWSKGDFIKHYTSRELRPGEVVFLVRYRERLGGRVLELGCGAGRLTGYLLELAQSVHGIDVAPAMVAYCRETYPRGDFSVLDLRDVGQFGSGSFDAVVATYNVLDVLGDAERKRVLGQIREVLAPDGLLMMSSHNLAFVPKLRKPTDLRGRNIVRRAGRLALMPLRMRNRLPLLEFERSGPGYAIVNDDAHGYRLLHYYISRDAQQRQLHELGFELVECIDNDGHPVGPGESGADFVELYYMAQRFEPALAD